MKKYSFAYLSAEDPTDKKVWSGTHYAIYRSLCEIGTVEILGPYNPFLSTIIGKISNQIALRFFKKRISYRHSVSVAKAHGTYFERKLAGKHFDFIIAPAASGEIAFLKTNIPVIYITDGTFRGCLNYHESLQNLTKNSIAQGDKIEQMAIDKSKFVIVSSQWAANSVLTDYHAKKNKVVVIPYGANFEKLPLANEIDLTSPNTIKLLFVGVYWKNKGGDIALNAYRILKNKGYKVSLTIVGCVPPDELNDDSIQIISFINKNDPSGQEQLANIYAQHHLLLLPTRFDCTPIVINEASAFAIPVLAANTGGVAGHLHDGVNGFLIPYEDTGNAYAQKIERLIQSPAAFSTLRLTTRKLYEEKLNWNYWKESLLNLLASSD